MPKSTSATAVEERRLARNNKNPNYQALTPAIDKALEKWALRMDAQGLPPNIGYIAPKPIKYYFRKLGYCIRYKIEGKNMWNMDEKGSDLLPPTAQKP